MGLSSGGFNDLFQGGDSLIAERRAEPRTSVPGTGLFQGDIGDPGVQAEDTSHVGIVPKHRHAVRGHADIHFNVVGAILNGLSYGAHGVFRRLESTATMGSDGNIVPVVEGLQDKPGLGSGQDDD